MADRAKLSPRRDVVATLSRIHDLAEALVELEMEIPDRRLLRKNAQVLDLGEVLMRMAAGCLRTVSSEENPRCWPHIYEECDSYPFYRRKKSARRTEVAHG